MTSASQASPIPPTTPLALASSSQPPRSNSNALSQRLSSPTAAPPSQVRKHAVTSNSTSPGEVNQLASHLTVVPNPSPMVSQPGSNASPEMSPSQSLVTPPPTPASISPTEQFQVGLSNQIPPGVMAPQALARRLSVAPNMSSAASSIKSDAPPPLPPPQDSPSPPNKMPARSNAPPNPAPVTGSSPSGHRSPGASNASASPFQAPQTQTSAALSSLPAVAQANANPAPADVPVPSSRPPVSGRSSRVQSQSSSQTSSASRSLATSTSTSGQAGPPANAAHTSPSESTPRPSVIASSHSASLSSTPAQVSATTRPTASSRPRIVQSKSAPTPANTKPKPASIASGVETTACTAVSPSTRPPISSWKDEYMLQKERADKLQTRLSTSTKSKLALQDELAKTVARDEDHLANLKNSVATFQAELFEARAKVVAKSAELVKANEELVAYKRTVVGAFRTQQKRMQEQEERNKVAKGKLKMILGMVEEEGEDDFVGACAFYTLEQWLTHGPPQYCLRRWRPISRHSIHSWRHSDRRMLIPRPNCVK
ncbi:hypothetical protein OF83DRAFT_94603 [Amylostereum chailletii]|nr:hypothetical protein OF83DRAFT_94603 [Amylostereum chailletii]